MNHSHIHDRILDYVKKGIKFDGRKLEEYRKISVEKGVTETAEGSARVKIGKTEVLAGVKLSMEKPYPDTPDEGCLIVGAELLPLSNPEFESGPPGQFAIELARVVDRGIRESNAIDKKKLCITKGEKVWTVCVDIITINDDGNLFDASALATIAALQDAKYPIVTEDGTIDYRTKTSEKLPLEKVPVSVTVLKIGNHLLVDPNIEEEKESDSRLTVATTSEGIICALQKGGAGPLMLEDVDAMIKLGVEKGKELRKYL